MSNILPPKNKKYLEILFDGRQVVQTVQIEALLLEGAPEDLIEYLDNQDCLQRSRPSQTLLARQFGRRGGCCIHLHCKGQQFRLCPRVCTASKPYICGLSRRALTLDLLTKVYRTLSTLE